MSMLLLLGTLLLLPVVLPAASPSSSPKQDPGAPPATPEAKRLEAWVGTWDAEVTMMGATSTGSEVCRLDCGGNWLVTEFSGAFMGQPYQGKGLTGFDASKGTYGGVWIDSSGSPMSVYTDGRFAPDGKRFVATVEGLGMDGRPARFEYAWSFSDARTRAFEIFQLTGTERELSMSIRYRRRG